MKLSDEEKAALLREIAEQNDGRLEPQKVVEASEDASHPFHPWFDWDNEIAGPKHRLEQARALIRSVRIEIRTNTVPFRAPQWVRAPDRKPEQQGYVEVTAVVALDARLKILRQELDRCIGVVNRLAEISAAMHIAAEFTAAQQALAALRGRLK